jgi:cellulose synthase/poly-beta-1,6-N-acetylglucosamine synthase-like glycosyltransferase
MLSVFLFAVAAQLFFWGMFCRYAFPASELDVPEEAGPFPPVSVIVCFRNEEAMLQNCLASILKQEYAGDFEIVAVDDNSTDNSANIVQKLIAETGDQLRLLQPGPTRPGKKDALTFGINNASHEHILLTDADCLPGTTNWLRLMTAALRSGTEVVLGVGEYSGAGHQAVDHFQRFEAFYVAIKYLSFARLGLPYMGVGRNLAYQKSFFLRSNGFAEHTDLPGGDDDLLVGNNARAGGTACVTHPQARTVSSLAGSWSVFLRQRMRHQSVGFRYRPVHQLALGLVALSHGLFFLLGLFLLFSAWWRLALLVYGLRFFLVFVTYRKSGVLGAAAGSGEGFEGQSPPVWMLPIFDALLAPWYLVLGVLGVLPAGRW